MKSTRTRNEEKTRNTRNLLHLLDDMSHILLCRIHFPLFVKGFSFLLADDIRWHHWCGVNIPIFISYYHFRRRRDVGRWIIVEISFIFSISFTSNAFHSLSLVINWSVLEFVSLSFSCEREKKTQTRDSWSWTVFDCFCSTCSGYSFAFLSPTLSLSSLSFVLSHSIIPYTMDRFHVLLKQQIKNVRSLWSNDILLSVSF